MNYLGKSKFAKITSVVLTVTTTVWLSGMFMLVPFAATAAVTIVDGDTVRNPNAEGLAAFDIYIVKLMGDKKFKRLVLNPEVFESYGHLTWDGVKDVDQTTIDAYATSELVRTDGDAKVYRLVADGDVGTKEWINMTSEEFISAGYDWDEIYTVNSTDVGNYNVGGDVVTGPEGAGIMLSSMTPATGYVAASTYDNEITKIDFTAGPTGYIIDTILVTRSGLSADADLSNVKLFDGNTQLGSTQSINSTTHKVTFANLNWTIPANGSKTLTVKGSIATSGAGTGDVIKLGLAAAADITLSSGTLPSATYPIYGNGQIIAGVTVGTFEVMASTAVSSRSLVSGTTDQLVGGFNLQAITEAFDVNKIAITEAGSAVSADLTNIKLKVDGVQIGSTVSSLGADEKATFTGNLLSLAAGTNKDVYIYADIADGITSERTVQWQIFETGDITAVGSNSGGVTLILADGGGTYATTTSPSTANTIYQGALTVAYDTATNPSDGLNTVAGAKDVLVQSFKFSATTREGLNVTYLNLNLNTEGADDFESTDFSNARLYIDDSTTPISTTGTIGSSSISFGATGSSTTLFNVPAGKNTVVKLKVDVSTTVSASERIGYYISSTSNLTVRGEGSGDKIPTANMTITAVDAVSDSGAGTINALANGTLVIASAPDSPAATTYTDGTSGLSVFKFRLTSAYEDMNVTTIKIRLWDADSGTYTTAVDDADFSNIALYDGATLLDTVSLASGIATFNLTGFSVPRDTTKTLGVVLDVPVGSALANTSLYLTLGAVTGTSGVTTADEITTTGADSLAAITETPSTSPALSNAMTEGAPTLTVAASTTPAAKSVVTGATDVWVGRILMTANNEDIKVTSIRVAASNSSTLASLTTTAASASWSSMKLKVNGSDIANAGPKQITDAGSNLVDYTLFDGIDFEINKDQTAAVDIYVDAVGTATAWYFGITDSTSQIQGAGLSSGTEVTVTPADSYASAATTITSAGALTVSVDADTPVSQNVAVGTGGKTGVTMSKIKFAASAAEDLNVRQVIVTRTSGAALDFAAIYLYNDLGTQIAGPGYMSGTTVTFTDLANNLFTVASGTSEIITIKADLNGTTVGGDAVSADAPILYIADATGNAANSNFNVLGESSAADITSAPGTPTPEISGNFGSITLYKSTPTISLNSASKSGAQVGGVGSEVLRFDVAANAQADLVLNQVALSISGNADVIDGDGLAVKDAYIYKKEDLSNPLAVAAYVTGAADILANAGLTATAVSTAVDGIPVGSNIVVLNGSTYTTQKLVSVAVSGTIATLTWTGSDAGTAGEAITIYYAPMQPGSGKLFFGGQTTITADVASDATALAVTSTDGFAVGDVIAVYGYNTAGGITYDTSVTVDAIGSATALTVSNMQLEVGGASDGTNTDADDGIDISSSGTAASANTAGYIYTLTRVDGTDAASVAEDANLGTSTVNGITIAAGTTKTFVVKGDTSGADDGTGTETLQLSFNSISDLNWDDTIRWGVTTLTSGLTLTGNALTY